MALVLAFPGAIYRGSLATGMRRTTASTAGKPVVSGGSPGNVCNAMAVTWPDTSSSIVPLCGRISTPRGHEKKRRPNGTSFGTLSGWVFHQTPRRLSRGKDLRLMSAEQRRRHDAPVFEPCPAIPQLAYVVMNKVASHMNSPPVSVLARFAPWRPSAELRRRRQQRWAAPLPVSQAGMVHSQATPLAPVRTRLTRQRQQRTVKPCATVSVIAPDLHGLTANT
jgi:hypothetical protein